MTLPRWMVPWRRHLVSPDELRASHRAAQEAPEVRARALRAAAELVALTSPNHLGERYHRALTGH
jgi:hypothetical protein